MFDIFTQLQTQDRPLRNRYRQCSKTVLNPEIDVSISDALGGIDVGNLLIQSILGFFCCNGPELTIYHGHETTSNQGIESFVDQT